MDSPINRRPCPPARPRKPSNQQLRGMMGDTVGLCAILCHHARLGYCSLSELNICGEKTAVCKTLGIQKVLAGHRPHKYLMGNRRFPSVKSAICFMHQHASSGGGFDNQKPVLFRTRGAHNFCAAEGGAHKRRTERQTCQPMNACFGLDSCVGKRMHVGSSAALEMKFTNRTIGARFWFVWLQQQKCSMLRWLRRECTSTHTHVGGAND